MRVKGLGTPPSEVRQSGGDRWAGQGRIGTPDPEPWVLQLDDFDVVRLDVLGGAAGETAGSEQ
jgi:hypothetical protein